MSLVDLRYIKIHIYHDMIGNQTYDIEARDNIAQFRSILCQSTKLALYENFHFEHQDKYIPEYQQVGQFLHNDTKLKLVFDAFSERTSRYHFRRIKKLLNNPTIWTTIHFQQTQVDNYELSKEQYAYHCNLDEFLAKPLTSPLIQNKNINKFPNFVENINFSGYNPSPYYRKFAGDFYYLLISTLENVDFHITANPEGFYLNQSTFTYFNPEPQPNKPIFTSLLDLLYYISPKFKKLFTQTVKNIKVSEYNKITFSLDIEEETFWLKQPLNQAHKWSSDALINGVNKIQTNLVKDWNQLFKAYEVAPLDTPIEKLNKEKYKYKLYHQFIQTAKEGALHAIQGKILALNEKKSHTFIHGSLLYKITQQSPFTYAHNLNQQAAPTGKQVNSQLNNLAILDNLAIPQLHLSHMMVVKYRGYKVVAQSIVPGNLNEIQTSLINSQNNQQFQKILRRLCKQMHLVEQINVVKNSQIVKVICSPILKRIFGSDKKKYIQNLFALSPRDYNFKGLENEGCILRPQLIKFYLDRQKCLIPLNTVLNTSIKLKQSQSLKLQQKKLHSMAKFAKQIVVPLTINLLSNSMKKYLGDTKGVVHVVHKLGLSSRYLGFIHEQAQQPHIKMIIEKVILVKTLKNIFRMAMRQADLISLKKILARMLNCIFGTEEIRNNLDNQIIQQIKQQDHLLNKKKKKKFKENKDDTPLEFSIPYKPTKYLTISSTQMWDIVRKLALLRYFHNLPQKIGQVKGLSNEFKFNKLSLLRDLCINLGIHLQKKQYLSQNWRGFICSDFVEFKPICKHISIQCKDLNYFIDQGDKMVQKCQVQSAIQFYNKAMQYIINNFGGFHEKLALIHKKMSNIYFRIGQIQTALLFANYSCEIFENLYGIDHVETIQNYNLLGLYHFAKRNFQTAQYYILKSLHLYFTTYGQCYPEIIISYLNLSTIYQSQKKYADAIISIINALNLTIKIFGKNHIHVSICYSALSALHYQIPDIQQCIKYQKKALQTLENTLKQDDIRLKQSKGVLQYYETLQKSKKIKQIHQKQQKKIRQLYNGMSLFKMPEPTIKQREQFMMKIQKMGKKKLIF